MLFLEATSKNAGVFLWGDNFFLSELYDLTHKCWDSSLVIDGNLQDILCNFSYDIRKAYDGAREHDYIRDSNNENIPIYGVKINWLLLLLAINYMRHSFAYLETTKKDQSIMYLLEYHVEKTLYEQFLEKSQIITDIANQVVFENQEHLSSKFLAGENYFLSLTTKPKRTVELLPIMKSLLSFHAMSDEKTLAVNEEILLNNGYCPEIVKW